MSSRFTYKCLLLGTLMSLSITLAQAADLSLASSPLFLGNAVKPNVMVMLDNSGSMKIPMYNGSFKVRSGFTQTKSYYGIFDSSKNYVYDTTIPVNTNAYHGISLDSANGAFKESNCTPAPGDISCWSGNYLNWLTTRRVDASRKVLVGGKLESRTAYDYGQGFKYKLLGNNEPSDKLFGGKYSDSDSYSPIPDNTPAMVVSPADSGKRLASYYPYERIELPGLIYDQNGVSIGEFGSASLQTKVNSSKTIKDSSWTTVNLSGNYTNPIVIAKPPSFNGTDQGVIRIRNVTANSFQVVFQEWNYKDGNHTKESVSYLVMEAGTHTLSNGMKIKADKKTTSKEYVAGNCGTTRSKFAQVSGLDFTRPPVVISSVMTFNDSDAVDSRVWNVSSDGFKLALDEEEKGGTHPTEDIGYIAIEPGDLDDTVNKWALMAHIQQNVSNSKTAIAFPTSPFTFHSSPYFLAGIQSLNESDTAALRLDSLNNSTATIHIEEEKSCDNEVTHANEDVGYIALQSSNSFNVALVVQNEPKGLLQDVVDNVRLGISFYRFDPNKPDIYNGNTIQGGTLQFKIPLNPFVKYPSDTNLPAGERGYRNLVGYIDDNTASNQHIKHIVDAVEHYPLVWGTTPIAENLVEVTNYFSQISPNYSPVIDGFEDFDLADTLNPERDPFYFSRFVAREECAASKVLIFTDGEPYKDADIPAKYLDYDGDVKTVVDCLDSTTKNTDCASSDPNAWGHDNLDDVAYWAYCDTSKSTGSCKDPNTGKATGLGTRDLRSDLAGNQFIHIDTVGFAGGVIRPILQDTADNAGGTAYAAEDGLALKTALNEVFQKYTIGSASAVAVDTGSIQSNSQLFLGRFNNQDWSGDLLAFPILADGSLSYILDANGNQQPKSPGWHAATHIPTPDSRNIITYDGSTGQPFRWSSPGLTASQKGLLDSTNVLNSSSPILDYLRGDPSHEVRNGGSYRNRPQTVLGDLIHSSPVYVSRPAFHYPDDLEGSAHLYSTFKTTINAMNSGSGRTPMVYVGANDGMLHGFRASDGAELMAYVPNAVYSRLSALTSPTYVHQYTVDGSPTVIDAFYNNNWHTVLAAGLRAGGQGIYALDITDPSFWSSETNAAGKVLWEFTDAYTDTTHPNAGDDLGFTFSQPNIVRLHNGLWAAVFGNGYNSTATDSHVSATGDAVLYIVDISDGTLIKKIDTGVGISDPASGGRPNGLATVAPVDINSDGIVDYIYAGDLYGNLWKFDVTATGPGTWDVAWQSGGVKIPLFTACADISNCSNTRQPITVRPQIGRHPEGTGFMVYFGTGKYLESTDNVSVGQNNQSFYGIWDKDNSSLTSFNRNDLKQRKILMETTQNGSNVRISSGGSDTPSNGGGAIDWTTQMGWYLDLYNTAGGNTDNLGERQASNPILRKRRIIFTTIVPSSNPCDYGGTGWLMELDATQGTRLGKTPIDLNNDGNFDDGDYVQVSWDTNGDGAVDSNDKLPISGEESKVGIITSPGITTSKDGGKEYKYNSGSTGNIETTTERPDRRASGRQSWRQLND